LFVGASILTGCALLSSIWGAVTTSRAAAEPATITNSTRPGTAATARAVADGVIAPAVRPAPTPGKVGGEGIYGVGAELQPGTYRTDGPSPAAFDNCYWERSKDRSGLRRSVIASGIVTGPVTVTINPTDGAFKSSGCLSWMKVR